VCDGRPMAAAPSDSAPDLVTSARVLAPLLAEQAAEAERLRRPTDAVIRALEEAGIFRLMVPQRYGGLELDLDTFVDVGLALSEGDASMAWVATFYIEHNWMFCQFPEAFQRELFADRSWVLAPGMIAPTGQAEPVDGGVRLSGRWKWATGVMHGDWVIVGAAPSGNLGQIAFHAVPKSEVAVEDTWYVDGMCGTGSNDVVIDGVFVPEGRSVSIAEMVEGRAAGARLHPGPLYRTPMVPILMLAASMPALGQARAVVRGFREGLVDRMRLGVVKVSQRPATQIRLAQAEVEARQAELLLRDVAAEVCEKRNEASLEERARWAASLCHVVHQSRRIIADVAEASGASAHFQTHPLQRALRDVNTLSCHAVFDRDAQLELFGRLRLGFSPIFGLF
jgi:3-hydroxy-9,10-secoandrosta-1,3,5(10)-triene-9,17-dione monooxygenase